jgi:cytidine deaminase
MAGPTVVEEDLIQLLVRKSIEVKSNAFVPYDNFAVGAALLTTSGEIYTGCCFECACNNLGLCAERAAVFNAVSNGHRKFTAIAVASNVLKELTPPCGACRQVLNEFAVDGFLVILVHPEGEHQTFTLESLLPHSFGPCDLHQNKSKLHHAPTIATTIITTIATTAQQNKD